MREFLLLATSAAVIGAGDVSDIPFANYVVQGGAFTVLVWVLWHLLTKTLPSQRKDFTRTLDAMATRYDGWEQTRHDDSEKLDTTLRKLSEHCARHTAGSHHDRSKGGE